MYKEFPYVQIKSDVIERLGIPWCMLGDVRKCLRQYPAFILNLDRKSPPGTGQGTHWTVVATNKTKGELFYYDPLGHENDGNYPATGGDNFEKNTGFPRELFEAGRNMGYNQFITNPTNNQYVDSWMCGYYAILIYHKLLPYAKSEQLDYPRFKQTIGILTDHPSPQNVQKALDFYNQLSTQKTISRVRGFGTFQSLSDNPLCNTGGSAITIW